MRTALLETSAAKSMRVNGKNNILLLPRFVLSTMSHESEHSESEFYYPGELSHAELLQSPTHSESKERNNQQANRRSRKQLFRINCPIINLSNKQTVGETSFLQTSKNSSWVKRKKTEEVNKVRYKLKCFLRVSEFLGEVG